MPGPARTAQSLYCFRLNETQKAIAKQYARSLGHDYPSYLAHLVLKDLARAQRERGFSNPMLVPDILFTDKKI